MGSSSFQKILSFHFHSPAKKKFFQILFEIKMKIWKIFNFQKTCFKKKFENIEIFKFYKKKTKKKIERVFCELFFEPIFQMQNIGQKKKFEKTLSKKLYTTFFRRTTPIMRDSCFFTNNIYFNSCFKNFTNSCFSPLTRTSY